LFFETSRCSVPGNITLNGMVANLGSVRLRQAGILDGALATSITHTRARVWGGTIKNMDTNWDAAATHWIKARRAVDGGGNGRRVRFYRGPSLGSLLLRTGG
jgi:hypothetical protein